MEESKMNMKNEILKLKSDYEYVSQSENDIIFVNNTFINVYHVLTDKMQRINKVHVKNVCIDMKDNYLFLSTFESGCLSIYDLKEGTFLTKKTILRNYEIENISPYCNKQFETEIDQNQKEVKCPE